MNYKRDLIDELRALPHRKASIENLKERISILKMQLEAIRAASTDAEPVSGGGTNKREDAMINNLYEQMVRKNDLRVTEAQVKLLEENIAKLLPNERLVLERFYVIGEKNAVTRLMNDLGYEKSQIYRIKDKALANLARRLYGRIEE